MKFVKFVFPIIFVVALITILYLGTKVTIAQHERKTICSLFKTQTEAQETFNNDPVRYKKLDGYDNDGVVCEHLPKSKVI